MSRAPWRGLALVAAVLLTACSTTPAPSESVSAFDRNKPWQSDHRIERVHMSEEQKAEFVARKLSSVWEADRARWQNEGVDIGPQPTVPLVRYVSWMEAGEAAAECLRPHGIEVQGDPNGGGVEFPNGMVSTPENDRAVYTCSAQYPIDPEEWQEWTSEQLSMLYDYWVEWRAPCLRSYGFNTPPPPDKNEWMTKFHTADRIWWDPGANLSPRSTVADMAKKCPMWPEGFRG